MSGGSPSPEDLTGHGAGPFTLAVASGKGGTGKTLVATNLAVLSAEAGADVVLVDCDVEAPNDHLFLPTTEEDRAAVEVVVAAIDPSACTGCGACRDSCAFGAVRLLGPSAVVFEEMCHGCGVCTAVCERGAIREVPRRVGEVSHGRWTGHERLRLVTGRLDVGHVKAPAVVGAARAAARAGDATLHVLDAPPGVACSAVAAVRGAGAMLMVTEPTPFGVHDLALGLRLGERLGIPMAAVVNRGGTGDADAEGLLAGHDVPVVARIPFDRRVAEVYAAGGLLVSVMADARSWFEPLLAWLEASATGSPETGAAR